ncbi:MAG: putative ABC transport system substrate-binding protein [Oleiphilaceae bacterium]|jgi:putative ABC transport system substrate-binding protein
MSLKLFGPLLCLCYLFTLVSCSSVPHQAGNIASSSESSPFLVSAKFTKEKQARVLLVNTNRQIDRYKAAEISFIKTLVNTRIHTVNLGQNNQPIETLQDLLNTEHFDAVYCIGAKALGSIDYIDPDMPVIFNSVLNWRQFNSQANYNGIASEVATKAQLTWFKYFFPKIKKIGVLYSTNNHQRILDAKLSAKALALQLITQAVSSETQLDIQAKDVLSKVDALWLISDPSVLVSTDQTKHLFEMAHQANVPIFTYHSFFMAMGATLSITADLPTTGRQAALMMKKALTQPEYKQAVQFPAGSSITLNIKKAEAYKLILNHEALDSVDELIGY